MEKLVKYFLGWLDLSRNKNNLKIPDSVLFLFCDLSSTSKLVFLSGDFLRLRNSAWDFLGVKFWSKDFLWVLLKALGIFFGF